MANLTVVFLRANTPGLSDAKDIPRGSDVRTAVVAIGATSVQTAIAADPAEIYVHLRAGAACWVKIGADPTAVAVTTTGDSFPMGPDEVMERYIAPGQEVAVIQA